MVVFGIPAMPHLQSQVDQGSHGNSFSNFQQPWIRTTVLRKARSPGIRLVVVSSKMPVIT